MEPGALTASITWCWWWSRREQGLAEVFPSLPLGRFLCGFDQGQVLPALLQGLLLGFGIAVIARARGSVYQLEGETGWDACEVPKKSHTSPRGNTARTLPSLLQELLSPQRLLVLTVAPTQTQGGKAPRAPAPCAEGCPHWMSEGPSRKENQRAKLSSHHHFLAVASQTRGQLPL